MAKNPRLIDLSGQRFGKWLVKHQAGNAVRGGALWQCVCDCGTERSVIGSDLRFGKSASCGCTIDPQRLGDSRRRHGATGSRLYVSWQNMRRRCSDLDNADYGGRGISVCPEWSEYEPFAKWAMANGYKKNLSIERKDVNGGYCPENCTWADAATQAANRRFVKRAPDGELWWHKAKANGITRPAYTWRIAQGWPMELVVSWPQGKRRVPRERSVTGQFT